MLLDFTHAKYSVLVAALQALGHRFERFSMLAHASEAAGVVMLRHDVDRLVWRSLAMARLEANAGCVSTYFFRVRQGRAPREAIRRIAALGHEIGYHYEDLADTRGDRARAWDRFRANLDRLRTIAPVTSIAMHGRPFSPWDSRVLWRDYDYRAAGVACEAYLDPDWRRWRYFTDTGRAWNHGANIRDVPPDARACPRLPNGSTDELIAYLRSGQRHLIISAHPERWAAGMLGWLQVAATDGGIGAVKRLMLARGSQDSRAGAG